jgi:hypothetical protein
MAKIDSVEFLTVKEAARLLRIDANVFCIWMRKKGGPPVAKLSHSCARIPKEAFMKWIEGKMLNGEKRA